jgi:hypothetical protein
MLVSGFTGNYFCPYHGEPGGEDICDRKRAEAAYHQGRASHTSAPAPSTVVEDITFEGAAIVQAAKREAAKAERERILLFFD